MALIFNNATCTDESFFCVFAGLARKEDFPYVTYYCPHCKALNRPKQANDHASSSGSPTTATLTTREDAEVVPSGGVLAGDTIFASNSPVAAVSGISES